MAAKKQMAQVMNDVVALVKAAQMGEWKMSDKTKEDDRLYVGATAVRAVIKELEYAKAEAERFKEEHQGACHLVARMHAAAVGEVTGPNRGVVEDVEDLRLRAEDGKRDYDALMREREQVGNALGEWELSERARAQAMNDVVALVRAAQMAEGVLREMHQHDEALEVAEALKPFEALLHARSAPPSP